MPRLGGGKFFEIQTPASRNQIGAEYLEVDHCAKCLQLIPEIAQPPQAIINIEKSKLPSHPVSHPSLTMEEEIAQIGKAFRSVHPVSKKRRMSSVWRVVWVFERMCFAWLRAVDSVILSRAGGEKPIAADDFSNNACLGGGKPKSCAKPPDLGAQIGAGIDDEDGSDRPLDIED